MQGVLISLGKQTNCCRGSASDIKGELHMMPFNERQKPFSHVIAYCTEKYNDSQNI